MSIWNNQSCWWKYVGQPTRPSFEDQSIISSIIKRKRQATSSTQAVVLGVTPEMIQLDWSEGTTIKAVDMNASMIETLYKPHDSFPTTVQQEYWQSMSIESNSVDVVVGDGIFTPLGEIDGYHALFHEILRILKPDGFMVIRAFIRPDFAESIEIILEDALAGKIKHFGTLKWRLAMALVENNFCVIPAEVHSAFNKLFPDRSRLTTLTNWSIEEINTIDAYQNMNTTFTFPTLSELKSISEIYVKIIDIKYGKYELSDRCPIIVFGC